jgi:hypothetical protein
MAQTGFTPIITYHSTTPTAVPTAGNLAPGELGLNIADMKLYCENSSGVVTLLASAATTGTVTSVDVSGGTTGLTTSGGPITTTGTITLAGTLAVTNGGTGITTVAQGDILYASGANTIVVLPKNTNATRYLANTGTSNNPAWAQIDLTNGVTGDLPFANLAQGSALSVLGVTANATADVASIAASTDNQVLRRSGTSLAFGAVNLASSDAVTGDLPFANLTQLAGLSVLGVTGNSTADVAGITAASDHQVLRRSGTTVAFGAIDISQTNAITGILPVANGGTGNAFFTVSGPATSAKTYTFANENMTIVGTTQTQTLTNKTITQRVSSTVSISSPLAFNSDDFDLYAATAQAGDLTINADAGTPTDGRKIIFRFTCDGTARTITFTGGASKAFKPVGASLTVAGSDFTYALTINKTTYFGCVYNTGSSRWEVVALSQEA